jgi:hypothetical protein
MGAESSAPLEGGYYAVQEPDDLDDNAFSLIKVLSVDPEGVHIRRLEGSVQSDP